MVTGVYASFVLIVGTMIATTDWSGLSCFDGSEAECQQPRADSGFSVIQTSSWIIAALGIIALVAAGVWSLRMKRARGALGVLTLCVLTVGACTLLWARV